MVTREGCEILIHIGMDTVNLQGQYFTSHVEQGQNVEEGDLLISFDKKSIENAGYDVTTPVLVSNYADYNAIETIAVSQTIKAKDQLMRIR